MPTVYVTAPAESAGDLARSVVEARLAACVNRLRCHSTYRWDGDVAEETEDVLLMKTTPDRYDALVDFLLREHPYDVPCIERFDESDAPDLFEAWVVESTRP